MQTRARKLIQFKRSAFVCSGGATKAAAFHVGVALALRDKGFRFIGGKQEKVTDLNNACPFPSPKYHPFEISTYVGSSAGALICTMLASGIPIETIINSFIKDSKLKIQGDLPQIKRIQYKDILSIDLPKPAHLIKSFKKSSVFAKTVESLILKNLRVPGFFTTRGLAQYLIHHILPTNHFNELKPDLFVVGTQLDHSRKIVFGKYSTEKTYDDYCQYATNVPISDAVGASMSVPILFSPYLIKHEDNKERYYIDGEIRETLSTHVARDNACDLIFCSYTHQPYHYQERVGSLFDYGLSTIVVQSIYQSIEQKIYNAKKNYESKKQALQILKQFFEEKKYDPKDLNELLARLNNQLHIDECLNLIFIHPEPKDHEMFFGDHFTLNPQVLQNIALIGYKRALAELRKYDLRT